MSKLWLSFAGLALFIAGDSVPLGASLPVTATATATAATERARIPLPDVECCKVCTKGKACGNSCIARSKDCHQPPGCACDAAW